MRIHSTVGCAIALALSLLNTVATAGSLGLNSAIRERNAYFGDLHLHTSYSLDAYILFGARVDPEGAYRYARGDSIMYLGEEIRRSTAPLDFMAVTDHSENIGVLNTLEDPSSPLSRSEIGKKIKEKGLAIYGKIAGKPLPGVDVRAAIESAWQREVDAANRYYAPGRFTTFIAYEWTSMPEGQNLHRNVIFRGDRAPNPFTALQSEKPEDLWSFLDVIRKQGYEALAIPHNSNASNGVMFDWVSSDGRPIDQAYAERRAANEPLVEMAQNKGASETHPALSPNDELSNFERYDHLLVSPTARSKPGGSYVRDALGRGLVIAERAGGVNPYKYGFVGGSDYHNGLSDSAESAFVGTYGAIDPTKRLPNVEEYAQRVASVRKNLGNLTQPSDAEIAYSVLENGSGNITGVWAEQNTRESIYDALRRKETFATSGTRLRLRFFGGWNFHPALLKDRNWLQTAYCSGVPMGGDLPAPAAGAKAPSFVIWASKDPAGANLDRVQVVKLWLENGSYGEKIFDVALSDRREVSPKTGKAPEVGNTVDLKTATYRNSIGVISLATVWQDPEFDVSRPAVYYLRVLEIPTPRWSTILAVKRGKPLSSAVPATVQERGWSSPIWYTPPR